MPKHLLNKNSKRKLLLNPNIMTVLKINNKKIKTMLMPKLYGQKNNDKLRNICDLITINLRKIRKEIRKRNKNDPLNNRASLKKLRIFQRRTKLML